MSTGAPVSHRLVFRMNELEFLDAFSQRLPLNYITQPMLHNLSSTFAVYSILPSTIPH